MKLMTVESIFINGFEKAECVGAIFNLIDLTDGAMFSVCLAQIVKPTEKVYWQTEI